jgi:hypothetical protein
MHKEKEMLKKEVTTKGVHDDSKYLNGSAELGPMSDFVKKNFFIE